MDKEKFTYLLKHPQLIEASDTNLLNNIIKEHPYFQAPRAIQLKSLKENGSFSYNQKLKEVASFTTDRETLFHFITSKEFAEKKKSLKDLKVNQIEEVIETPIPATDLLISEEEASQINSDHLFEPTKTEQEEIEINPLTPLSFTKNETHSFSEWLKLTSFKPIKREEKKKKLIDNPLIEKFIKNNPKISPVKNAAPSKNLAFEYNIKSEDLMTETLAKVYISQGNYKKAIQAYKILSLKNPEKSGLFADQIRAIQKLQNNK